jgi:hypothetical protein
MGLRSFCSTHSSRVMSSTGSMQRCRWYRLSCPRMRGLCVACREQLSRSSGGCISVNSEEVINLLVEFTALPRRPSAYRRSIQMRSGLICSRATSDGDSPTVRHSHLPGLVCPITRRDSKKIVVMYQLCDHLLSLIVTPIERRC